MSGRDPLANPEPLIPQVYGYVAYRIGTGPDAADVTSETFERAVRYRTSYDARKGPPIAWRRLDLDSAVALLNERDRELIALRYGTDLKARQIAELLGERTNTIEVAISRALDRLREHLESPPPTRPADEAHPRSTSDSPV